MLSSAGGWSAQDSFGLVMRQNSETYRIGHGGPITIHVDRLAIVQPAMPEGATTPSLIQYNLPASGAPVLKSIKPSVLAAAFAGDRLAYLDMDQGGGISLCLE